MTEDGGLALVYLFQRLYVMLSWESYLSKLMSSNRIEIYNICHLFFKTKQERRLGKEMEIGNTGKKDINTFQVIGERWYYKSVISNALLFKTSFKRP